MDVALNAATVKARVCRQPDLAGGDCNLESLYMRGSTVCLLPRGPSAGPVNDRFLSAIDRSAQARGVRRRRLAAQDHARAVALYLAGRPARPAGPGHAGNGAAAA